MTYAKTPSGKTSKGEIGIQVVKGRIKVNFPRQYFAGEQVKKGLLLSDTPDGHAKAKLVVKDLQHELEKGKLTVTLEDGTEAFNEQRFQEILHEHGIIANLKIVKFPTSGGNQVPPKPELSVLEVWDMYCEYKREDLAETTYQLVFKKDYLHLIEKAINAVGEDALKMRNWMVENYSHTRVKKALSHLSKAYRLAIKQKLVSHDLFDGMAEDVKVKKKSERTINQNEEVEDDKDVLDKTKSFTWDEVQEILKYIQNNNTIRHYHDFIKFKFLTGCRTGEAIAFWWCDVDWDAEKIIIRRTYNRKLNIYKNTKNDTKRIFPMPKNGELWNLLKSIPEGEPNENTFKSKTGKVINGDTVHRAWHGYIPLRYKGIIPELVKQGKIKKYLPCYNTRHTFITHQIFDLERDPAIVNAWCEHNENTSSKHYRDTTKYAIQINPELPANQQVQQVTSDVDSLKEVIQQQSEQIKILTQALANLQAQLNQQK